METKNLNDQQLEQVNGGVYCPAQSGVVESREQVVFIFKKGDIVNFKGGVGGIGTGYIKGEVITPVYNSDARNRFYPSYIVRSFLKNEMICLKQDEIYIQYQINKIPICKEMI